MIREFPTEAYFIGRKLPGGSIELYSLEHTLTRTHPSSEVEPILGLTPVKYSTYDKALKEMQNLNRSILQERGIELTDLTDGDVWRVYHMRMEEVMMPVEVE